MLSKNKLPERLRRIKDPDRIEETDLSVTMKHSITVLAAAAMVGATCAAKADNDIKPNPYPPSPKPSASGSGQQTEGSGQQNEEPGITDKGHDLDSVNKTRPRTRDDVIRDILRDRHSK